jgi:hypothetical protein
MFEDFPKSNFEIVGADGSRRGPVEGIYTADMIAVLDARAQIYAGDELRRKLPNGSEEAFEVVDPVFYEKFSGLPAHYQVQIRRKGAFKPGTGGNYNIHISGSNARVNINSTDNSKNIAQDHRVFGELRAAFQSRLPDGTEKTLILSKVQAAETAIDDEVAYRRAYQDLITSAANHMTILAPFLPILSGLLG